MPAHSITTLIQSESVDDHLLAARAPDLDEDLALKLLQRRDLRGEVIEALARHRIANRYRTVQIAIAQHPRTPRHVSLPVIRRMFTFDLMQLTLAPAVATDIKMVGEEVMVGRLESLASGERLTLAKSGSARLASALLLDPWEKIVEAALENPRLTETWMLKSLSGEGTPQMLIDRVARHPKWSLRRELQLAMIKNVNTPLAHVLKLCPSVPVGELAELLRVARLNPEVQAYLQKYVEAKRGG